MGVPYIRTSGGGIEVPCGHCGSYTEQMTGARVYPHRKDLAEKLFWVCIHCDAYVGCHQSNGLPFGSPADAATRKARSRAHAAFDPLWKAKIRKSGMKKHQARGKAYKWLAEQMGMTRDDCHIGMMTAEQADRVADICRQYAPARP